MTTRAEALSAAVQKLARAGVTEPERDARLLYRWSADLSGAALHAGMTDAALPAELVAFEDAVNRRAARCPISQIIGFREFWGRRFRVTGDVLDPRPDSETLIEVALRHPAGRILDLGTGSGCLLATLLAEWPVAQGVGVDISEAALAIAVENATALRIADRAQFLQSDWFVGIEGRFDLIVANPPYLTAAELAQCQPELMFEPSSALSPGGDGLSAYREIAAGAGGALTPGGRIIVEIGATQAGAVSAIFADAGIGEVVRHVDLNGRDRVLTAQIATVS